MAERMAAALMPTENQMQDLKPVILERLRDSFPEMGITDIYLRPDEDFDGDPILRVYIGYEGERPAQTNVRATAISRIIEALTERRIDEFPITTFLKTKEFRKEEQKTNFDKGIGGFYNLG